MAPLIGLALQVPIWWQPFGHLDTRWKVLMTIGSIFFAGMLMTPKGERKPLTKDDVIVYAMLALQFPIWWWPLHNLHVGWKIGLTVATAIIGGSLLEEKLGKSTRPKTMKASAEAKTLGGNTEDRKRQVVAEVAALHGMRYLLRHGKPASESEVLSWMSKLHSRSETELLGLGADPDELERLLR